MKFFGWSTNRAQEAEFEQVRAERNAAAMTTNVGNAAVAGAGVVAARIHRDEIAEADRILRSVEDYQWRLLVPPRRKEYRPDEFAATLRKRLGAAAAVEAEPQFAPILSEEIERIEDAVADLRAMGHRPETMNLVHRGRMLIEDLHTRLGHAEAIEHLGSVAVFARHLPGELR